MIRNQPYFISFYYVNNIIEDERGNRLFKTKEGTAKEINRKYHFFIQAFKEKE